MRDELGVTQFLRTPTRAAWGYERGARGSRAEFGQLRISYRVLNSSLMTHNSSLKQKDVFANRPFQWACVWRDLKCSATFSIGTCQPQSSHAGTDG